MACRASRDENGITYHIPAVAVQKTPGGRTLPGSAEVLVWWARMFKGKADEKLIIRQENNTQRADVVELTLGQVYDLIHALGHAVMHT